MARFHDPISHISYIQKTDAAPASPHPIPTKERRCTSSRNSSWPWAVRRGGDRNRGGGHEGGGPLPIQRRAGAAGAGELSRPGAGRQRDQRRGRHQRREDPDRQGRRGRPDPGRVRNQAPDLIQRDRRVRQLRVRHFLRRLAGHGAGGRALLRAGRHRPQDHHARLQVPVPQQSQHGAVRRVGGQRPARDHRAGHGAESQGHQDRHHPRGRPLRHRRGRHREEARAGAGLHGGRSAALFRQDGGPVLAHPASEGRQGGRGAANGLPERRHPVLQPGAPRASSPRS